MVYSDHLTLDHSLLVTPSLFRLLVLLCLAALGCTPRQGLENAVLYDRIKRVSGVAFGSDARQRLDVYSDRRTPRAAPVVVFIYPGRWKYGSRRDYLLVGNALARLGWVVVIPDYRLYPASRFPDWVTDGAAAIRWTRDSIARYGGDPSRIVVIGHSAGAHTVAMLAMDEHFLRDAGVGRDGVSGFVSISGPVDTTWTDPDVQDLMGPAAQWPLTYPANFVDGDEPPLLLLHGAEDHVVGAGNSERLAARVRARGGCALSVVYPRIGHVQAALALAYPALHLAPVQDDVRAFVENPAGFTCEGAQRDAP